MSRNNNRDSVHILETSSLGHLSHPEIPGFSVGGAAPFTIEVWFCPMGGTDGILYGQTGGFSLSIENGFLIFQQDSFCTAVSSKNWRIETNRAYFLAVRYDGDKLAMFLGGIQVAQAAATALAQPPSGRYVIGQNFSGGIRLVRVLSKSLTDQEILGHNTQMPEVNEDCVFQTDFSTRQFMDVSKNALPLSSDGYEARCTMLTACTQLSGRGKYVRQQQVNLGAEHTVLYKFWPDDAPAGSIQTLWDMAADQSLLSLEMVRQEDHTFQLRVMGMGRQVAASTVNAVPQMWHDAAVVLSGGKVRLYLDGAAAGSGDFTFTAEMTRAVIGGAYVSGGAVMQGFSGLTAYCAQFSDALPAADVAAYADCPPYLFAPSIASLMIFSLEIPSELCWNESLGLYGRGNFVLVAGTTPLDTPEGIPLNIPQEEDPAWSALSKEDQWTMSTVAKLVVGAATALMGLSIPAGTQVVPRTAAAAQRTYAGAANVVRRMTGPTAAPQAQGYIQATTIVVTPGVAPVVGGAPGAGGGLFSFFSWGAIQSFISNYWAEILAATAAAAVVTAAIAAIATAAQSDRPALESDPTVESVCWNHKGDARTGSIHFHRNGDALPDTMTFCPAPDGHGIVGACVLVPQKLGTEGQRAYLEVVLRYGSEHSKPYSGTLNVQETSESPMLGEFTPAAFTVAPGQTCTVQVPFQKGNLSTDRSEKHELHFSLSASGIFLINHHVTVYTLPDAPIAPWTSAVEEYRPKCPSYVRTEFLDMFLRADTSPADFRAHAVQTLNESGFTYDTASGSSHYIDEGSGGFNLSKFIRDKSALPGTQALLNCTDCATIVSAACAMVGIDLPLAMFIGEQGNAFECNRIQAIGCEKWDFPAGGSFSYHHFNVDITAGEALGAETPVYDACLKVDGGEYPNQEETEKMKKTPLLPVALPAEEKPEAAVKIGEPYKMQFYRERLVKNGQVCGFWQFVTRVLCISVEKSAGAAHSVLRAGTRPELQRVFHLMKTYGLTESNGMAAEERWPLTAEEERVVERGPNFVDREILWQGKRYGVRQCWQSAEHSTGFLLGMRLATISAPLKEEPETGIGERCFVIMGRNYLFSRMGQVFYVYPLEPSHSARALTEAIDRALAAT